MAQGERGNTAHLGSLRPALRPERHLRDKQARARQAARGQAAQPRTRLCRECGAGRVHLREGGGHQRTLGGKGGQRLVLQAWSTFGTEPSVACRSGAMGGH